MPILFFKEKIKFRFSMQERICVWIRNMIKKEGAALSNINFIFCCDDYLRKINKEFLKHDYYTDIITFDNSGSDKKIEADIFISIDTVNSNSKFYKNSFNDELHRVMAHGVLHLLGYSDKSDAGKKEMKKMEDLWLAARKF